MEEAIAKFREVIRLRPDRADAHCNLGIALRTQGKLEEAIAEFRAARDLAPPDSELAGLVERALAESDH